MWLQKNLANDIYNSIKQTMIFSNCCCVSIMMLVLLFICLIAHPSISQVVPDCPDRGGKFNMLDIFTSPNTII